VGSRQGVGKKTPCSGKKNKKKKRCVRGGDGQGARGKTKFVGAAEGGKGFWGVSTEGG